MREGLSLIRGKPYGKIACAKVARHQASRARDLRGTGKMYKSLSETEYWGYAVLKENWSLELNWKWIQARNKGGNTPTLLDDEIFYSSSCNLSSNHDLLDP